MSEMSYNFDIPQHQRSIIKVIGVGGGGTNAVNHMFNQGIRDVEFVVCNTDHQSLNASPIPNRIQIGENLTQGLGVGANPEKGKHAAIESRDQIRELLEDGTKMLFITAGMGGGTGTGAAPVIAKIAKDMDILTVGIVTIPFAFEGKKKMQQAEEGVRELKGMCDTVLVILNDKLREIYGNLPISEAFGHADDVLTTAAKGIAEIITVPGYVNVDFEDVRTVMLEAGAAVMGSATTEGDNRARRAAEEALSSPLLNNRDIHGSKKILLSIVSGEEAELQMDELTEITEYIQEQAGDEAEVIFGHGVDQGLGHSIRVTVITTGFEEPKITGVFGNEKRIFDLESTRQIDLFDRRSVDTPKPVNHENEEEKVVNRGYMFSNPKPEVKEEEEEEGEDGLFSELENDFEVFDASESDEEIDKEGMMDLKDKKDQLREESKERIERLRSMNPGSVDDENFREKLDVPAYIRKKVDLENVPHSKEKNISRYNLNDDNQILGNNRFLHDNVD